MRKNKLPLDIYELFVMPKEQMAYLAQNGWHFNRALYERAASRMFKINKQTGKKEKIPVYKKEEVDALLKKFSVDIEDKDNYDYVYIAQMCRADFLGSSVADEHHLALFVKDYITDEDQADGFILRRYIADTTGKGESIDWVSALGIED